MQLSTPGDIRQLVEAFYAKAKPDPVIGHFFTKVVALDWDHHIPLISDFWSSMLLGLRSYQGNPMDKHFQLDSLSRMEHAHFERWLELWTETVDELFVGDKAEEAKRRAASIAAVMEHQVERARKTP